MSVELHLAYVWDCDNCGRENFIRSRHVEFSEEEAAELRDEHGVQPWEQGEWHTRPQQVDCPHCGRVFDVDEPEGD